MVCREYSMQGVWYAGRKRGEIERSPASHHGGSQRKCDQGRAGKLVHMDMQSMRGAEPPRGWL